MNQGELIIEKLPEFDGHKFVCFIYDPRTNLRGFIAIHRGGPKTPSLGATRYWHYSSEIDALRDALRLSRLMSYKSALAGLKYGGAKAVIIADENNGKNRTSMFSAYADKLNYLGGKFITGTDVGMTDEDVKHMQTKTDYVIGSQVDPAYYTAVGVVLGIKTALGQIFGSGKLAKHSFAIQGVGKTGEHILAQLYETGAKIIISDTDLAKAKSVKKRFSKVKIVNPESIYEQKVEVFIPCALSGVLNPETIPNLKCKIIAGSANNQLAGDAMGELLSKLGILYVPDFVVNSGGLISVVDELENDRPSERRINQRIRKMNQALKSILKKSIRLNCSTSAVANEMAEKIFNKRV